MKLFISVRDRLSAFTLIELLIVVAIIAILAAIAIPNFLEAQTRAKVSRAKADMRSLATGIEAYTVDYNQPPYRHDGTTCFDGWHTALSHMTTPVAYMTTIIADIFQDQGYTGGYDCPGTTSFLDPGSGSGARDGTRLVYDYSTWLCQTRGGTVQGQIDLWNERWGESAQWRLNSAGPDLLHYEGAPLWGWNVYDPTNGTISLGNITRWGGGQDE